MPAKKIEDLPQFTVSLMEEGQRYRSSDFTECKLHGAFDHLNSVRESRSWLLLPQRHCLIGDLESLDQYSRTAVFVTDEKSLTDLVGKSLPYVDGYWQAYHVWMVVEPWWSWKRKLRQRAEVTAEVFEAETAQTIAGQEVKKWIRVKEFGAVHGRERVYPVFAGDLQPQIDAVIARGWEKERCELCDRRIMLNDHGFVDPDEHWVCEPCYARYVAIHDLSFLDS
jgi:hypothetical protein